MQHTFEYQRMMSLCTSNILSCLALIAASARVAVSENCQSFVLFLANSKVFRLFVPEHSLREIESYCVGLFRLLVCKRVHRFLIHLIVAVPKQRGLGPRTQHNMVHDIGHRCLLLCGHFRLCQLVRRSFRLFVLKFATQCYHKRLWLNLNQMASS